MPIKRLTLVLTSLLLTAACTRAEYVVLRNGQRLNVTGYQLRDGKYLLQLQGGFVEVPYEDVAGIEPEASTPEELGRFVRAEIGKWADLVRQAGIKPE